MAILANLKYFGKEQVSILDVEKVHQRHVSGPFTSSGLTMVAHASNFMASLNINCWMSKEFVDNTSWTHTTLLPNFLGWLKATIITSKWLLKHSFASNCSQYCGYTTLKLSTTPWVWSLPYNSSTTPQQGVW